AYQYCAGDPVGKVDPSGEKSVSRVRPHPQTNQPEANCFSTAVMVLVRQLTGKWPSAGIYAETVYWYGRFWPGSAKRSNSSHWGKSYWKLAFRLRYGLRVGVATSRPMTWTRIKREVGANRAIFARGYVKSEGAKQGHAFVITGYRTKGGRKQVEIVSWNRRDWADYTSLKDPSKGSKFGKTGAPWVWTNSAYRMRRT
ncbi:MAG: C39 family peptidase, partial [Actinomycetota bacterium]|nr:C39 family peptidase [Actinomycetota bacterium]